MVTVTERRLIVQESRAKWLPTSIRAASSMSLQEARQAESL